MCYNLLCDIVFPVTSKITGKVILFHLTVCVVKFLYFLALLVYLFDSSAGKKRWNTGYQFNWQSNHEPIIKDQGITKLSIALILGLVHECVGILGICYPIWTPNLAYLLMNILVVPLYLYYANLEWFWLVYAISLISTIGYFFMLIEIQLNKDGKKELAAKRAKERNLSKQKNLETRANGKPSRERRSEPKDLEAGGTGNLGIREGRSKPTREQRSKPKGKKKGISRALNSINNTIEKNTTTRLNIFSSV